MDELVWLAQNAGGMASAAGDLHRLTGGIKLDEVNLGMEALLGVGGSGAGIALGAKWLWDRFYKAGSDNWTAAKEAMGSFAELAKTQRAYLDEERAAYKSHLESERADAKAQRDEIEARALRDTARVTGELELTRARLDEERGRVDRALDEIRAARQSEAAALQASNTSAEAAADARRALQIAQEHKDKCEGDLERLTARVAELEQTCRELGQEWSEPFDTDASRTGRHKRVSGRTAQEVK